MNEDTYVAGKMLLSDWKIAYRADAQVYHSHDYRFLDEFKRYFDIGVFHARTRWLQVRFGNVSGEGRRYVISELRYLRSNAPSLIPSALLRSILKWLGFKLGISLHQALPLFFKHISVFTMLTGIALSPNRKPRLGPLMYRHSNVRGFVPRREPSGDGFVIIHHPHIQVYSGGLSPEQIFLTTEPQTSGIR